MFGQVAHQALHGLVLHHTDADKSGVLQARSEQVDTMNRPIKKGNLDFAEVMLAKFSGQTFETNQRRETAVLQRPLLQLFTILCVGLTQLPLAGLYSLALVKASAPEDEA
jgi:hypothetical protein